MTSDLVMHMKFFRLNATFACILAMTGTNAFASGITVSDAWFRLLPANLPAGGYFTLHNDTANALMLDAANSPACGMLLLHKSEEMSGMSRMSDMSQIEVPARGTLAFAPGGYHLMCMSPAAVLKQGAHVPVTLGFADGAKVTASFAVRSAVGK